MWAKRVPEGVIAKVEHLMEKVAGAAQACMWLLVLACYILIRIWIELIIHFTSVDVPDHLCNRQAVELSVDCTCQQPVEVNGRH